MNNSSENSFLPIMQHIEKSTSQKNLSEEVGFSVGKVNYVVKALLEKGFIKMENFVKSNNKRAYGYILTNEGLKHKMKLTEIYIQIKKTEYEALQKSLIADKKRMKA